MCNNCKIPNHFASVCRQKSSELASALIAHVNYNGQSDTYTVSSINNTNAIPATICSNKPAHKNLKPITIQIFPDSGASICLPGPHHLDQMRLKHHSLIPCQKEVKAVGGSKLICHGWVPINFTIGTHTTNQPVYFCDKVDRFYFSKKECQETNILSPQFPYPMDTKYACCIYHFH